jgi:DNA-binding GntR family transcriptional regulator
MPLRKARRVSLATEVSAQLARAIVSGGFPAGANLREIALAEKLGVSRAPVREALIELEMRGLVTSDRAGRTRVPRLSPADIHDIHAVRLALDPLAARLAAERGGEPDFAALEKLIEATRGARTVAEVSRLDAEFHDLIVQAAASDRLAICWAVIRDQVDLWLAQMHLRNHAAPAKTRDATIQSHRGLLAAIRSGKPAVAEAEGRRHIAGWLRTLPKVDGLRPPD